MPKAKRPSKQTGRGEAAAAPIRLLEAEEVDVDSLRPHPRNYKFHPETQLEHIGGSLEEFGQYRNVVCARDGTILAGHGVWESAKRKGAKRIKVVRLPIEPTDSRALKVIALDNELPRFAESDDRALSEMLRDLVKEGGEIALFGTGFDTTMLAAFTMVTRPASEIADMNAAAQWVGMPEYRPEGEPLRVVVQLANEADREAFMKAIGATTINKKTQPVWSIWWPERQKDDLSSVRFEAGRSAKAKTT